MNTEKPLPPEDPPRWSNDKKGELEEEKWDQERQLRGQEQINRLRFLKVYGWVAVSLVGFLVLCFSASFLSWLLHYLTPWHWLDSEQLGKIQSVIFSGSLGAIVSFILQKQEK